MEQRQHREVTEQIYEIIGSGTPGELVRPLRAFAREELDGGYPREALIKNFEHVRADLEDRDDEARENDVLTVMDALSGYCPPAARL